MRKIISMKIEGSSIHHLIAALQGGSNAWENYLRNKFPRIVQKYPTVIGGPLQLLAALDELDDRDERRSLHQQMIELPPEAVLLDRIFNAYYVRGLTLILSMLQTREIWLAIEENNYAGIIREDLSTHLDPRNT